MWRQREDSQPAAGQEERPAETNPVDTLILDFQSPEL